MGNFGGVELGEIVKRSCVVCGKQIAVTIYPSKRYIGGHYFGRLLSGNKSKSEYWECDKCFNE
ncbi:MAG: hypothetical protein A2Y57_04490 [Candidatus Woykebacteria bacterium RBG_13_40_7b]|uniref:Uncharacterized protein n=1 Tax=Candidatus Woykebacteria bacterium RBG_13_40_7b TaxID=1802594 RepID=A0A1G1W8R2_9BACT|nr:MAG: hypothetical protein A2Y57_04490 [Candidatus Woykebacteria bacterium RBG_13_40_7b]